MPRLACSRWRVAVTPGVGSGMQDPRKIQAYQRAHALAVAIDFLSRRFSRTGHTNLRQQLTRAADSISTNIAEGCGAASDRDFARFLDVAVKSANETEHHLLSARDRRLISEVDWKKLSSEVVQVRKMTYVYRKRVLESAGLLSRPDA